jgi:uncharacterized protein YigE (DUF2233 family)
MNRLGAGYAVCQVHAGEDLRLFLNTSDGTLLGTFDRLNEALSSDGKTLAFAMNAGMYHPDRRPVGLYVENGKEVAALVRSAGPGNFGLVPNGVFCIETRRFVIKETLAFDAERPECLYATQSGPLMVQGGALHPRFIKDSNSRYIRNGVGVSADGETAYFAISDTPVNFDEFARFFRDGLNAPDALYFDGNISRLYAPDIGRDDFGFPMGPIVGLAVPAH